jgi:hypothetical protein
MTILRSSIFALLISAAVFLSAPALSDEDKHMNAAYISPDEKATEAFAALPQDQPFDMLNMIKFKDVADYAADSGFADKGWTGAEAYAEYGRHSGPIAQRMGATTAYGGAPQLTMIGPDSEQWDAIFVVRYPNAAAFFGLVTDAEYLKHAFHRSAAVEDSRLVRIALPPTDGQGGAFEIE